MTFESNNHTLHVCDPTSTQDKKASESMEAAMDIMALGGIVRTAVKLIRGINVDIDDKAGTFTLCVFSIISWFKVGTGPHS